MKKLIAILAILMLVPFTAFGLESLSEDALENVTGQAGVSINMDIRVASVHMDTLAWGDGDGVGGSSTAGWVGLSNFNMTGIQVHPRTDWVYGPDASKAQLQFLTIDVATNPAMYGGATYVHINPGTLEIIVAGMTTNVALGANAAAGLGQVLGSVEMTNMLIRLNQGNFIDIYSGQGMTAGSTGVTMTFNFNVDVFSMTTLTWGDADGAVNPLGLSDGGVTTGGVVGFRNFIIEDMIVNGTVTIDVATIGAGAAVVGAPTGTPAEQAAAGWSNVVYIYGMLNQTSDSFVHIGLRNINVTIASMRADVVVGATAATATGTGNTLGSIYASNIQLTGINGFVDIFAH